ncbi:PAS domain-containing protein [Pontibacter kalidii]|uniref:PAS domain-containing protein n=1 Tax=Pontibacter kalidii TaxID=2592049 RepID=UPI00225706A8|nr:PAS domain-containing protein [Pontibacter kalidii]
MQVTANKPSPDFALVFRALPGLYLLLSPELKVLDATDLYACTSNFKIADILGKHILDTFPENPAKTDEHSKQNVIASLNAVLATQKPHTMPTVRYDVPLVDGGFERRYWNTTHSPILNSAGDIVYILQEASDVTASVLQEQLIEQNRERLSLLTSTLNAVTWEYDIEKGKTTWGGNLQHAFGYKPEEMGSGKEAWLSRVHPKDIATVNRSFEQATSAGNRFWSCEYEFRKADGSYARVLDQGYFIYDITKKPIRIVGSMIDLTESRQSEENLKETNARFWHLLEKLPYISFMADAKGRAIYFNDNWYEYTGIPKGQVDGWINAIHPEDSALVLTSWNEATRTGHVFEQEYRIRNHIDGQYRWFLDRCAPMYDEQGNVKFWIGTITDIDELRETITQMQLKEQQFANILNLLPAHLCLLMGPAHVCRYVTPGVFKMYGNRHYVGKPANEIWPETQPINFTEVFDKVYQQQEPVSFKEVLVPVTPNYGEPQKDAYFNIQFQPLLDPNRHVEGVLMSAVEVTELVECEQRATRSGAPD